MSIRNAPTQTIYKYISRTGASNVSKTDIVNTTDELVKQNLVVNNNNNKIQIMTHFSHTTII